MEEWMKIGLGIAGGIGLAVAGQWLKPKLLGHSPPKGKKAQEDIDALIEAQMKKDKEAL